MRYVILILLALATGLVMPAVGAEPTDTKPVLVIDFIGLNDNQGRKHAETFRDALLPDAEVVSIGIKGSVPDKLRANAGYDAIVGAGSAAEQARAVDQAQGLIRGQETIVSFDFNESWIPQQLRGDSPWWLSGLRNLLPNKIEGPAMVAAKSAQRWLREHPDGVLILRGHSDGTYAVQYIFDYLRRAGLAPYAVVLESPRQTYDEWAKRARRTPQTLFLSLTSTADLPRATIADKGYGRAETSNWVNIHIQGVRQPLAAHGVVTDYAGHVYVQRTSSSGVTSWEPIRLGDAVGRELPLVAGRSSTRPRETVDITKIDRHQARPGKEPPTDTQSVRRPMAPPPPPPPGSNTAVKQTGGIELTPQALVMDASSQRIVLLTGGGHSTPTGVDPRDLALALWLAYTNQDAAFSLDPEDPKNPAGKWLRAVYIPESLRGTFAGKALFEADFLLKQYAFGVRVEGDKVVKRTSAAGLASVPELMSQAPGAGSRQWARMWIVPERVVLKGTEGVVWVETIKMGVRARRQVPDPSARTGLRDVDTEDSGIEARFARHFTELYDKLAAAEAPELSRVTELAKAVALARWMKEQGVRVDLQQVVALLNKDRVQAVDKISALDVRWRSTSQEPVADARGTGIRTTTREISIFGGVDLKVVPRVIEDRSLSSLRQAVSSGLALAQANAANAFKIEYEGRAYQAFVLPFSLAGYAPARNAATGNPGEKR